ncbi:hypothetical protein CLV58_13127 [Spirosoma oryzae]|uniref:Uncharacterized protein n=1 Tax=Spirosoma oryzae TaxID=1469603 RepID=A0A2T0S317_9BACT|nr:hypothetical protein [Spirosoma oryzae]PRY27809.1 hypothetical protein CLV58_13127 [Spirosoma oryzae]
MQPVQKSESTTDKPTEESKPKVRRSYGGRRAKPDAVRKESVVKVYLDEREDTLLRRLFKEYCFFHQRLSLSEFVKKRCQLDGPGSHVRSAITDNDLQLQLIQDVRKLASHLGSMSTNYNQSVKRINSLPVSKKLIDEVEKYKQFHNELAESTDELKQLIIRLAEFASKLK